MRTPSLFIAALAINASACRSSTADPPAVPKALEHVRAKLLVNSDLDLCWVDDAQKAACMYTGDEAETVHPVASLDDAVALVPGSALVGRTADGVLRSDLPENPGPVVVAEGVRAAAYALSGNYTCWVKTDGSASCAISGEEAKLDLGGAGARQVAVSSNQVCALLEAGGVRCWPLPTPSGPGVAITGLEGASAIALGYTDISSSLDTTWGCAIVGGGNVRCWGDNLYGQAGTATDTSTTVAAPVMDGDDPSRPLAGVVALDLRHAKSGAILRDGSVRTWGESVMSPGERRALANRVPDIKDATQIAMGSWLDCAAANGQIVCWGTSHDAGFDLPFVGYIPN
ncbi:MAG: RCC1 domain-containing protein [Myxococcota bacterium]